MFFERAHEPTFAANCHRRPPDQDGTHDIFKHVGQEIVAATEVLRQSFVVEAHEVQNRGEKIVDVDFDFDRVSTVLVSRAVDHADIRHYANTKGHYFAAVVFLDWTYHRSTSTTIVSRRPTMPP